MFEGFMPQILNIQRSEYTGVLNIPGLRIYQGSEYAPGSEYVRVLDKPRFSICQGYTWF